MAQAPQNIWNNSWGSQTNRESTPPAGWTWDFGKNYWEYTGVIPTTPAAPTNTAIYQTSSIDCFPDVVVNTSGDPVTFPTGEPVHIPGITPGKTNPTPPAPPANANVQPVPTFGKFYNVCFDDALLNQKGWTRPRFEGCKLRALYYNEYTSELNEGKEISPIQNPNLDTSIDGLQFMITASFHLTASIDSENELRQRQMGNPFEFDKDSGVVYTLQGITRESMFFYNEFRKDLADREKYPPKSLDGTNQLFGFSPEQSRTLNVPPFGPKVYDYPLVPTSFYKLNPYTQEPEEQERKAGEFTLIDTPIKLNPIDPEGLNGGPFFLGTDSAQDESNPANNRLATEYQIKTEVRDYIHQGPWSYVTKDGTTVSSNALPGGVADLNDFTTWGYNQTFVSRSAILSKKETEGDLTYGNTPVIENYSNAIFFGNTVYGYQQSDVFPGPGPDFSYIKLEKAYIFNSDDDEFYVQEIKSEGEDATFQRLMQSTFPWATDFRMKLLDYDQENNLKTSYGVHWNRGYFSEVATYSTASAHQTGSGHYPGTGRNFRLNGGKYEGSTAQASANSSQVNEAVGGVATGHGHISSDASADGPAVERPAMFPHDNGSTEKFNEGALFRLKHPSIDGGGYAYMASDTGAGEGAFFYGTFKRAGADLGREEKNFPKYQELVAPGNWKTGPGTSEFFGLDPLPGGMRYYQFRFWPVWSPVPRMSALQSDAGAAAGEYYNSSKNFSGRVLSGTFRVNDKNPSLEWWFSKGGEKDIKWVSESLAGDVTSSMKMFMDECHKQDDLYILTFNEAKNVDKSFNQGFHRENHPYKMRTLGNVPGYTGSAALGYTDATNGDDSSLNPVTGIGDNTRPYSYYTNYTRPLNTFGSILFSNRPEAVGVKNAHNLLAGLGDAAEIGMGWYDYSQRAQTWSSISGSQINPATNKTWGVRDEGYRGIYSGYGPMGGIYTGGINAPRFMNGNLFIQVGDASGLGYEADGNGSQTERDANGNVINTNGSYYYDSVSVWTGYMYGNNWGQFWNGQDDYIDHREKKGWPTLNTWTISKLEERPNFILADINKEEELPQGVGNKGFILIPDTLNPRIKANLDFYLSRAGLIDKTRAPKHKDKSIKRNTYLPPKIKIRDRRKRKGFFHKLLKRAKGKKY